MPIERRGRSRWKLPFGRSSTAAPSSPAASVGNGSTPMSFLCPISSSLMADPVIIPTGHTFERACIEACREFKFTPPSLIIPSSSNIDDYFSSSSSSFLIPNAALRAAIFDWCDHASLPRPSPVSRESARALVQNLISNSKSPPPPPPKFQQQIAVEIEIEEEEEEEEEDYATNNKNKNKNKQQQQQFSSPPSNSSSCSTCSTSSFSSSERDQIHLTTTRTPHSSSASSSNDNISSSSDPLEESILIKLKSPQISVKESGLITLRQSARESSDSRISLCTPRILAALVPMILFSSSSNSNNNSSTNATAALVNLSIEPANKVKIVRSGAIPPLVEALKKKPGRHCEEARYNAAGALFSLSLEDENKLAIGVLGAIPPLINLFCEESAGDVARVEAGMALYHLSLAPNNLSKIAKTPGAVKAILNMAVAATATATAKGEIESSEETATRMLSLRLRRVGMMVLASLARRNEGRVALMDADAIKAMVGLMMESAAGREEEEYCLAVMYEMSKGKGSLRFRALARAAGAERVLLHGNDDAAARGEVGKEMVRRILKVIRGDHEERGVYNVVMMLGDEEEEEEQEVEEVGSVVSDGLVSFRRRRYDDFGGTSTTNSANF